MDDDKSKKNELSNFNPKESTEKSSVSTTATFKGLTIIYICIFPVVVFLNASSFRDGRVKLNKNYGDILLNIL